MYELHGGALRAMRNQQNMNHLILYSVCDHRVFKYVRNRNRSAILTLSMVAFLHLMSHLLVSVIVYSTWNLSNSINVCEAFAVESTNMMQIGSIR